MTTALGQTFDATQVEPNTGPPPPVPTGWYNVMITEGCDQSEQGRYWRVRRASLEDHGWRVRESPRLGSGSICGIRTL